MWNRHTATLTLLAIFSLSGTVLSAKSGFGEACAQADTHLDTSTWALDSDCDATTYCATNGTCAHKGCRSDIYPYGYSGVAFDTLPPLCPDGQFCPDEGDQCLTQIPVNGTCQKDRDDECAPPPNVKDLAGPLNTNGSVCLNYICYYANITLGQTCVLENTQYTAYDDGGTASAFIVSRDNCANNLYCDGTAIQCLNKKVYGATCTGNKECLSYNCDTSSGLCGKAADQPVTPASWVYAIIGLGIVGLIVGVMISLWFAHRRTRNGNQIKLEQYYNEQIAYRQSILSMHHAKNSLLSLPANTTAESARRSLHMDDTAYTSALLPPNMRNDSSAGWSDGGDSEILLIGDERQSEEQSQSQHQHQNQSQNQNTSRFR